MALKDGLKKFQEDFSKATTNSFKMVKADMN